MAKKKVVEKEIKEVKKKESIDIDALKKELNTYIEEAVRKNMNLELERSYKRTIRDKNMKLIVKNMIITILLLVIVYLVYILNDNDYFDKFFIEDNKSNKVVNNKDNTNSNDEKKEFTLDELKEEYAYLLDNIYINENSVYVDDYYNGKFTVGLKNYLTMNMIDISSIGEEENYNVIENNKFKKCYEKKFIGDYTKQSFNYNGNMFRYIGKLDAYITDEIVKENSTNIKRVITKIDLNEDDVVITTVEGLVSEDKLYNVITKEEIAPFSEENMISNIDKLNVVIYTFDENDRLVKIAK